MMVALAGDDEAAGRVCGGGLGICTKVLENREPLKYNRCCYSIENTNEVGTRAVYG